MKSKASIKGHPLHPILVAFPIAFFIGTLGFDILGSTMHHTAYHQTAAYLEIAGVVTGLIAAVPGLIDYFYTVPPESSAKTRATQHALVNVALIVVFAAAFILRYKFTISFNLILGLEILGAILLFVSGWLGGTLVYRNQIGVDPRYAEAGKWKEKYFDQKTGTMEVAAEDELQTDQMQLLHVGGKRIVLGKTDKEYVAFDDFCSHKGGSLAGGMMICGTVQCPWHGSQFDCKTGKVKAGPADKPIKTYHISVKSGKVYLSL